MKRTASLLTALAGLFALGGCVIAPLEPAAVHASPMVVQQAPVYVRPAPPPRAWRDRDGDGVPNRYDRRPDNPYRY